MQPLGHTAKGGMLMIKALVFSTVIFAGTCAQAQTSLSQHTENVLTHVILHEMGHALIREFDLPVLANEEVMADAFATTYIVQNMPERAVEIITARAISWELEGDEESVYAEHPDDRWRAGQMICLAYGLSPPAFETLARDRGMTGGEAGSCLDFGPEIGRAWRRIITDLTIPPDALVTEFGTRIGEGPWANPVRNSDMIDALTLIFSSFDWHSRITLSFDNCEGGASWSRNGREILICDDLIARFEAQDKSR